MEKKIWRKYPDECACCGYSRIEVYTDSEAKEGWVWDGDPIKCKSCPATGTMSVHDEDDVGISWDEDTFTEDVQDE